MSPIFRVRGCVSKLRNFYTNKYPMDIANFYGTKLRIKMTKLQYHYIPPWMFVFWKTRDFLSCVFSLSEMGWAMPTCDRSIHFQKILRRLKPTPFLICHSQHEFLCPINKRTCLFCVEFSMELNDQAWLSSNTVVLFIHYPKTGQEYKNLSIVPEKTKLALTLGQFPNKQSWP